jgi:hypothetical protein
MRMGVPIHSMGIMEEDRDSKLSAIKDQIERGEYRVEPAVVADAILRRLRIQKACSYPASGPSASVNTTPPSPSVTDPTQVRPGPMLAIASRLRAAAAGAQMQIS